MSRPRRAGGVFWGVILVATGLIFLLKNLGYPIYIWTGLALYWPVLLILWGIIKLFDYARWKRAGQPGPLFGAGEVVLLIVVILSGTALTAAANMSPDFGYLLEMANIDLWDITGNSYQFSEHYEKDVPSGSSIEIINRYGNVEVTPAETDRIVVDVAKTVIAADQTAANDLEKVLTYSIVQEGDTYRVISTFNRDQNSVRGRRFKTSLTVKVPRRSSLVVNNRNGAVKISELTGEQRVTNAFGKVAVGQIMGNINIVNRNDDVTVKEITGDANISNEFGSTEVDAVSGTLELRFRNGNADIAEVKGDAKISGAFGSLKADDIHGGLNVDSRMTSIEVSRVGGDATIQSQFQSVDLDNVKGSVNIDNRNGSVEVHYEQPPAKIIRIMSRYGDVRLVLPRDSAFTVEARTRFGDASSDFPELTDRSDNNRESLSGQVGSGGPEIRIDNTNGSIRIER
jgi:hypothetical protein